MSDDPRLAGRPHGMPERDGDNKSARKGSVRAARERLQQAQMQERLPDRSRTTALPQRPNQLVSQFAPRAGPQPRPNLLSPESRGNGNAISPTPPWPLSNDQEDVLDSSPGQNQTSQDRGPPPERPPRPTSDQLPIQTMPPRDDPAPYQSDEMVSPTVSLPSRPLTTSSAASEASSLGSIPDFPVPQPPLPTMQPIPRKQPSLGPPPSSRRGPSSYYTQMSYVSPIAEESEPRSETIRAHHGSYASSNVIPSNVDSYYLDEDGIRSDDEETVPSDHGRNSRASDHDDQSGLVQPTLVRQASLGRRTKPSITTIKSVENLSAKRKQGDDESSASVGAVGIGGAMLAAREGIAGRGSSVGFTSPLSSGTGLIDNSSSSSESLASLRNKIRLGELESQRALDPQRDELASPTHPLQQETRQNTLGERVGKRRPPKINVEAVREAEARGSLTSLPDLIKRATRLAANLDRGKTASRMGLDFWENGTPEKNSRRSGSLSDMLAAFPPPGEATPRGGTPNGPKWPPNGGFGTGVPDSALSDEKPRARRRRCCGMRMWTFVTLLIILLFLIAAAVVVPIVLILLPKMRHNNASSAAQTTGNNNDNHPPAAAPTSSGQTGQCQGIITCQNDGVAILNSDRSCNCVCINGFTGKTCATQRDSGCTTTNLSGTANNATLGSRIPRLLSSAQNNFSVPLDPPRLLSLFSELSLSCTSENALVTFNGLASRSALQEALPIIVKTTVEPTPSLPILNSPPSHHQSRKLHQRQTIGVVGNANEKAPTATPNLPISSNLTAIDFARVGVLLVLQETRKLDAAANAQEAIQDFLANDSNGNGNDGGTVKLASGYEIDLSSLSIKLGNGTTIQAKPSTSTTR